ncbi:MAG TPA: helix-turn-helix transcriptional regulator [Acidimicrobiia bacterium]|nr:helix-turn-helix transcriptional regulator [Acidimicrobiia bacterium]
MGVEAHEESSSTVTGMRVRAVRELSGMSRHEVARSTGLTRREIAAIERGSRTLDADEARALAGALNVEPEAFLDAGTPSARASDDTAARIDEVIGHDPDGWHQLPATVADLPKPLPFELPESERRTDLDTRQRIDNSWAMVRRDMDDVLDACAKVSNAGSGDDMHALLKELEARVDRLSKRSSFQRHASRHNAELAKARGSRVDADRSVAQSSR